MTARLIRVAIIAVALLITALLLPDIVVEWSEEAYERISDEYGNFAQRLGVDDLTFIPLSALHGDNVVKKSDRMTWYDGSTLLHYLEHVNVGAHRNLVDFLAALRGP